MRTDDATKPKPTIRDYVLSCILWLLLIVLALAFLYFPAALVKTTFTGLSMGLRNFLAFVVFFVCLAIEVVVALVFSRPG